MPAQGRKSYVPTRSMSIGSDGVAISYPESTTNNFAEGNPAASNRSIGSDTAQVHSQASPPKKRGRPKGSKTQPKAVVLDANTAEPPAKRPRGRPKGSKNKPKDPALDADKAPGATVSKASGEEPTTKARVEDAGNTENEGAESPPQKRGRGRPKGSKDKPKADGADGSNARKNCGRKAGSKDKKKATPPPGTHIARKNCGRPKGSLDKGPRKRKGSQGGDL